MQEKFEFDLSGLNTFRMKVKCACYIEYESEDELKALDFSALPQPVKHIGAGSNLLFTADFPGTILHSAIRYFKYFDLGADAVPVAVGAGVTFDDFVARTCADGLWGAENLSLIPGEVGAAAVQNIGAYGAEVKDIISGVVCYDTVERRKVSFKQEECRYGYRDSMFKNTGDRYVVTSVLFRLQRKYSPNLTYKGIREALAESFGVSAENVAGMSLTPAMVREAIVAIRRKKLPDPEEIGSAGSFFKNPVISREQYSAFLTKIGGPQTEHPHFDLPGGDVKIPAAWLIDKCGLKSAVVGGAALHQTQPLVLVNKSGAACPEDILGLENHIIETVRRIYGITLTPEVEHICP